MGILGGVLPVGDVTVTCQSAYKFDPVSASNFDLFERRGLAVALVSSELAAIAETRRARVVSSSRLLNSPTVVAGLDDVAMVCQAVEQRGRHLGVAKHAGPFTEGEIGGDDDGRALVEPADEMEQELAAGLSERQVTELVG